MLETIAPDPTSDWQVVAAAFDPDANRHWESVLALGTGYLSLRSCIDEGFADDLQNHEYDWFPGNTTLMTTPKTIGKWGCYLPVLNAKHPYRRMGLVNLPWPLGLELHADGERLDLRASEVVDQRRWLDLKTATLYRTLTWRTRSGCELDLRFMRFMDPSLRFVCIQRLEIAVRRDTPKLVVTTFVDNDLRTNGSDAYTTRTLGAADDVIWSDITTNVGNRVVTASSLRDDAGGSTRVLEEGRRISQELAVVPTPSTTLGFTRISAVVADAYFEGDLAQRAVNLVAAVAATEVAELHRRHVAWWDAAWRRSDVVIEADDPPGYCSQRAMRQAVYHLLRAKGEDEPRAVVDPKGMLGEIYYGAAFWDMDIFINPFYIYTHPVTGRNTPAFRAQHLEHCRELARSYGYRGARYPWMQAVDGIGVIALWQYADHQIHVTADVVIGMWHYVQATGDWDFLFDEAAEVILETARYWRDRCDQVRGRGGWHLYGVMGPDEYKPLTNNNAYTNFTARFNLRLAGEVAVIMAERCPEKLATLRGKIGLTDEELAAFAEVAEGLVIPVDEERKIVWQCDGFDDAFVEVDIDAIWQDKTVLFGKYLSQEKLFRSKTMKQSDVTALMSIFPTAFDDATKANSYDYYDRYNIHDSSNSMCHHLIVAAHLGRVEQAWRAWLASVDIDFGTQPRAADGPHLANVGGMWQEAVFGFAGMTSALCADRPTFAPCFPEQVRRIAFRIVWQGTPLRVAVTHQTIEMINEGEKTITVEVRGTEHEVGAGAVVTVPLASGEG